MFQECTIFILATANSETNLYAELFNATLGEKTHTIRFR